MSGNGDVRSIEEAIDALLEGTEGEDEVEVQDVLDTFSHRLLGPAIALLGFIIVSPLGAIPLLPTIVGILLVLIAGQRAVGLKNPWLPRRIRERSIDRQKLESGFEKVRPWAKRIDRWVHPRLTFLTKSVAQPINALAVVVMGCLMPPLEIVPFGAAVPAASAMLLGLAVMAYDGVLALVGWAIAGAAVWLVYDFLL